MNVVDSANAGADEEESKPPAFQIIVLVRKHKYPTIYLPPQTNVSASFLQSPLSTLLAWAVVGRHMT